MQNEGEELMLEKSAVWTEWRREREQGKIGKVKEKKNQRQQIETECRD